MCHGGDSCDRDAIGTPFALARCRSSHFVGFFRRRSVLWASVMDRIASFFAARAAFLANCRLDFATFEPPSSVAAATLPAQHCVTRYCEVTRPL